MENLIFSDGLKTFAINGDESRVIRFSPTDIGIVKRFQAAKERMEGLAAQYGEENSVEAIESYDAVMREIVDDIIGSPVSDTVFGAQNCCSMAGCVPIALGFLEAVAAVVKDAAEQEQALSRERIEKYTSQLT